MEPENTQGQGQIIEGQAKTVIWPPTDTARNIARFGEAARAAVKQLLAKGIVPVGTDDR